MGENKGNRSQLDLSPNHAVVNRILDDGNPHMKKEVMRELSEFLGYEVGHEEMNGVWQQFKKRLATVQPKVMLLTLHMGNRQTGYIKAMPYTG